jgi:superfamily II DNA/RNA helicase
VDRRSGPRALVVAPTRELAAQVHAEFERLAVHTTLTATSVFGGVPIARQIRALRQRPDVVVACPGRLLDLLGQGAVQLDRIEVLVLDEADHMFDMGFLPDVRRILRALPPRRQNLLFSATMPREIRKLADTILNKPAVIELGNSRPAETIAHALYPLAEGDKVGALEKLLAGEDFRSAIVFLRTKRRAKRLAERLEWHGHAAVAMQGNMSQPQRERALAGFREGRFSVLVATDIAARGLDIVGVSHVINFDVPNTPDAYTHRIGRTGRSEMPGTAFTFVTPDDADGVRAIEKRLGASIERRQLSELGTIKFATLKGSPKASKKTRRPSSFGGKTRKTSRPRLLASRPAAKTSVATAARKEQAAFGVGVVEGRAPAVGSKGGKPRERGQDGSRPRRQRRRRA